MTSEIEDRTSDDGLETFVVRPSAKGTGPAVVFLHWFDESPNANRTQYLDEASALAELGVTSLLPQLRFPWSATPTDSNNDLLRIRGEVAALKKAVTSLLDDNAIDSTRLGVVGHDFGAMYGTLLLREVAATCAVLVAPTPRWSDWFLPFWPISTDRFDYMRALDPVDPVNAITVATCPLLFQFATNDFYIAPMDGAIFMNAAPEPKQMLTYEGGHALDVFQAREDRLGFLTDHLGLDS